MSNKVSDNLSPSLLIVEGSAPSQTPSGTYPGIPSGDQRLFIDSADHKLKRVNHSGTVTNLEAGTLSVTTKGDLQGYDTAANRIPVGTDGYVLTADSTQALGLKWASGGAGALTLITDTIVGASPVANVNLSSIVSTYKHLLLVWSAQGDVAAANTPIRVQVHGDTGSNYDWLIAQDSAAGSTNVDGIANSSMRLGSVAGSTAASGTFNGGLMLFLDYASTHNQKTIIVPTSAHKDANSTSNLFLESLVGWWRTAGTAIDSILLFPTSGNFVQYSRFTLYGLS